MSPDDLGSRIDRLCDRLTADGDLLDPAWRAAFHAAPRHLFVPERAWAAPNGPDQGFLIDRAVDPGTWWDAVYSDAAIITQRADGTADVAEFGEPSSSCSAPGTVAEFLSHLSPRTTTGSWRSAPVRDGRRRSCRTGSERETSPPSTSIRRCPRSRRRTSPARATRRACSSVTARWGCRRPRRSTACTSPMRRHRHPVHLGGADEARRRHRAAVRAGLGVRVARPAACSRRRYGGRGVPRLRGLHAAAGSARPLAVAV